jgi:hypothetical protein
MIRLCKDDQTLLADRAAARGMAPATYVSVLTRAHLRSLAALPKEELLALKRTSASLGASVAIEPDRPCRQPRPACDQSRTQRP